MRTARAQLDGAVSSTGVRQVVDAFGPAPALAYEVTVNGVRRDQTPSKLHVLVDARSRQGAAVGRRGGDRHRATASTRATWRSPHQAAPGAYKMVDPTRGNNSTTDLRGATAGNGTTFTDADDVWGNSATSDRATAGVDAHYGAQVTFDYYKNVLGRNGIFNNGTGVRSRVHYGNAYNNAFWDGTPDDLRRRGRQRQAAHGARRRRPRDVATASPRTPPTSTTPVSPAVSTRRPVTSSARWSSSMRTTRATCRTT